MRTFQMALHTVARAEAMRGTLCHLATPNWLRVRFFSSQRAPRLHKECTKHQPAAGNLSASFVESWCPLWLNSGVVTQNGRAHKALSGLTLKRLATAHG